MMNTYRTILLATMTVGLAACGGGESDSPSTRQDTDRDESPSPEAASTDAGRSDLALSEGVTMAMVEDGKSIFAGRGICATCHGRDATGMPNLGGNLTDEEWIHSDGSYEGIVRTIMNGVTADASTVGTPMLPKGGSGISDDQVKAVAAYVWALSR
jgi:mono/diheme cytochrome c family protein